MSTDFEEERMRLSSESSTDDALVAMDPLDIDDIKFYLNLSTRYKNRINSYSTYVHGRRWAGSQLCEICSVW